MFNLRRAVSNRALWAGLPGLLVVMVFSLPLVLAGNEADRSVQALQQHVKYLASKELEGRSAGSEGNWKAARYIADYFARHNVKPIEDSYFQEFMVTTGVELAGGNAVKIKIRNSRTSWKVKDQFIPLSFSENRTVSGELMFAGYGISADEHDFDEYADIDVKGKLVIVLRSSPDYHSAHGKFAEYASLRYKLLNAREKGAAGIIYVTPTDMPDKSLISLSLMPGSKNSGMLAIHATREAVDALLPENISLAELENAIKSTHKPRSMVIPGVSVTVTTALTFIRKPTANVVGIINGRDSLLAQEYLIAGAHFDHVGWGLYGSRYSGKERKIHFGADDNASGTAGLLELAAGLAASPPGRSVVLIAFSAEEMGLLGSEYYCKHPLVPLEQTVMMLNMDMIGRLQDRQLEVTGTGTSPGWNAMIDSLGQLYDLIITKIADGGGPSDHASFYNRDMPVINLFTGLHNEYHTPEDTWDKLNYEGLATLVDFAGSILRSAGNGAQKPAFVRVEGAPARERPEQLRVTLGTIPDYSDHPRGLRISGVRKDTPAEKGGMQAGDIIVKFGNTPIKNIYDLAFALGKYHPGDKVNVMVLRGENDDQEVRLEVILEGRDVGSN